MFVTFSWKIFLNLMKFDKFCIMSLRSLLDPHLGPLQSAFRLSRNGASYCWSLAGVCQFTFWTPSQSRCGLYSSVSTRKYPCFWRPSVSFYLPIRVFEIPIKIFYIFGITFEDCEWNMWRSQILEKYPWSKWLCHIFLLLLFTFRYQCLVLFLCLNSGSLFLIDYR